MSDYTDDYVDSMLDDLWVPNYHEKTTKKGKSKPVCKFKEGDIVRLKAGNAAIRITYICGTYITGRYVKSDNEVYQRHQDYFVHYEGEATVTNTNKLYVFKDNFNNAVDLYGHYLATNSQGEWVMEVKGSGQIMAIAKDKVQEVLPYTISVKFVDGGTTYSYLASKDQFPVGFYLVKAYSHDGWQIAQVTAVDTKSNKATKEFAPIGKLAVDLY